MIADTTPKAVRAYKRNGAYCAIGGAAHELGLEPGSLGTALINVPRDGVTPVINSWASNLFQVIASANDWTQMTKVEIGQKILDEADEKTLNTAIAPQPLV